MTFAPALVETTPVAPNVFIFDTMNTDDQLDRWKTRFDEWGIDRTGIESFIPERRSGFDILLPVPKKLTPPRLLEFMCNRFNVHVPDGPHWPWPRNDRSNDQSPRAVWARSGSEADYAHQGKSAIQLWEEGVTGIDMLERMLLECQHLDETGMHLDSGENSCWTLCTGSRYDNGFVPVIHAMPRFHQGIKIRSYGADTDGRRLRVREVVC